jgi:Flp pilus assembly protein TadD
LPPSESITPRDRRADEIVAALSARGDSVGVVKLMEAWLANGTPTARARVHEGRAFLRLRLMDRALVRAREASDALPDDPDALRLLAEIYLERGWPTRARKPLEALKALDAPDLGDLLSRSAEEAPRPEASAREVEQIGRASCRERVS